MFGSRLSLQTARGYVVLLMLAACEGGTGSLTAPEAGGELVSISPVGVTLLEGETVELTAVVRDRAGEVLTDRRLTWASTDPAVARVHSVESVPGRGWVAAVIGEAPGTARIVATADGRSGEATITVTLAILVGAGDIASCESEGDEATARLLDDIPGSVFTAGDNAYPSGSPADFADCYDPAWGRHRERTRPAPGNHDYKTPGASGYFAYFGGRAGDPGRGYYSYDLGAWHIVVINSNLDVTPGSPQDEWLGDDLRASQGTCELAYWHHPRFSSARHGSALRMQAIWETLYQAGVDAVVSGHDHTYERFAPQTPDGHPDPERGIRQFVVGTGGRSLYEFPAALPNSQVRNSETYGVLKFVLHPQSYEWEFIPASGGTFIDSGSDACH